MKEDWQAHPFLKNIKPGGFVGDVLSFAVFHECNRWKWDEAETYLFRCFQKACEYAADQLQTFGGEVQIIEFNPLRGHVADISRAAIQEYGLRYFAGTLTYDETLESRGDPNVEHQLTDFELGTGRYK